MKLIQLSNVSSINYPIGLLYLKDNLIIVSQMAAAIHSLFEGRNISLWCRGSSGAIISGIISSKIPIYSINHVKKAGEENHSGSWHDIFADVNVIVDDFIKSGQTVNAIYNMMEYKGIEKVDCLCVSSDVYKERLDFKPDYIIAHSLKSL
jgi:hypothetical protein